MDQLGTPTVEEGVATDEQGIGLFTHKRREGRIDLADCAGFENLDLQADGTGCFSSFSHRNLCIRSIGWIDQYRETSRGGHQFAQEFQPFCRYLTAEKIDARHISARPGETCDQTETDRILGDDEDDGDCRSCCFRRYDRTETASRSDHSDLSANQVGRQLWQPIRFILGPAVVDRNVLALDET